VSFLSPDINWIDEESTTRRLTEEILDQIGPPVSLVEVVRRHLYAHAERYLREHADDLEAPVRIWRVHDGQTMKIQVGGEIPKGEFISCDVIDHDGLEKLKQIARQY
jgi:hypothetical protein